MKFHADEALGSLQQEKEYWVKDHETYERGVIRLRNEVEESLQQTLKRMYKAFNQTTDHVEALRLNIPIHCSQFDPFKVIQDGALAKDVSVTSQYGET